MAMPLRGCMDLLDRCTGCMNSGMPNSTLPGESWVGSAYLARLAPRGSMLSR